MTKKSRTWPLPVPTWTCPHCKHVHKPADLLRLDNDTCNVAGAARHFRQTPRRQIVMLPSNNAARKQLLILVIFRLCLLLSAAFILLFAHEPLQTTVFQIAMGGFFLAGMLIVLLTADRMVDWDTTPTLLAYALIFLVVVVPSFAENMYVLGCVLVLILTSVIAPWIARQLKKSSGTTDITSTEEK
jgi:hypothetical protein